MRIYDLHYIKSCVHVSAQSDLKWTAMALPGGACTVVVLMYLALAIHLVHSYDGELIRVLDTKEFPEEVIERNTIKVFLYNYIYLQTRSITSFLYTKSIISKKKEVIRMRSEGYSSRSVCLFVCLSVCLRLFSNYRLRGGL